MCQLIEHIIKCASKEPVKKSVAMYLKEKYILGSVYTVADICQKWSLGQLLIS